METATQITNVTGWNSSITMVTTELPKVVWPQWVEITVPLICIIVFIVTLIIIFLKPSKPGDEPIYSLVFKSKEPEVVFVAANSLDTCNNKPSNPDSKNNKDVL